MRKKVLGGQTSLKTLQRYTANNANVAEANDATPIHLFFLSAYHFHYFHFQFCVLSIKIYQRIYSRKSDNNSVTRGKARFIYLQLQLHGNLFRVRRLPQGSLFHEPVTPLNISKTETNLAKLIAFLNSVSQNFVEIAFTL